MQFRQNTVNNRSATFSAIAWLPDHNFSISMPKIAAIVNTKHARSIRV